MWKPALLAAAPAWAQASSAAPSVGTWSGGFGSTGPERVDYESVVVELTLTGKRLGGRFEGRSGEQPLEGTWDERGLRFVVKRDRFRREWFASIPCPVLWLFGAIDRSNPSLLCVERLEEVKAAEGEDWEVVLFPTGNHSLVDAVLGGPNENLVLRRSVPELCQTVDGWLTRKGFTPR